MIKVTKKHLVETIANVLIDHNTARVNALSVANALAYAEIDGKKGHGISRVLSYAAQAKSGKVNGHAKPEITQGKAAVIAIDAMHGFAYPAFDRVLQELPKIAQQQGIGLAAIHRSHHHGVAGHHVEKAAQRGMIALLFGNTPAAMAAWGGKTPLLGTNPIAFAAPIKGRPPIVIDLATSKVARGPIVLAAKQNKSIPEGWAIDEDGQPTIDPHAALKGSMLPLGDAKGAALAMMVEILAACLTGAAFSHEASSFFEAEGEPPNVGQVMMMIDPSAMPQLKNGQFTQRLSQFAEIIMSDGARLPGSGISQKRNEAETNGIMVDDEIWKGILDLTSK